MRHTSIPILLLALLLPSIPAQAAAPNDILIVAHRAVAMATTDITNVRSLFLKLRSTWPSGEKVIPINAKDGTPLRLAFQQTVLGMTATEEARFWQEASIKGGVRKPSSFSQPLKALFKVKSSIGYVFRKDMKPGAGKVLLSIPAVSSK